MIVCTILFLHHLLLKIFFFSSFQSESRHLPLLLGHKNLSYLPKEFSYTLPFLLMKYYLIILSLTFFLSSCSSLDEGTTREEASLKVMIGTDIMKDASSLSLKTDSQEKYSGYESYEPSSLANALASSQKVALFFHAAWCSTCKALDKNISANLASLPMDTMIFKVDYDSSDELRKKYGVTIQHTTVLIDKDMNLISKRLGARNIAEIFN